MAVCPSMGCHPQQQPPPGLPFLMRVLGTTKQDLRMARIWSVLYVGTNQVENIMDSTLVKVIYICLDLSFCCQAFNSRQIWSPGHSLSLVVHPKAGQKFFFSILGTLSYFRWKNKNLEEKQFHVGIRWHKCYSIVTVERISSYKPVNNKNIKVMNQTQPVLN